MGQPTARYRLFSIIYIGGFLLGRSTAAASMALAVEEFSIIASTPINHVRTLDREGVWAKK
jgi:hypothetical protein